MPDYRKGSHTVYDIQYHFVWVTKYRYKVLRAEVAERTRDIIVGLHSIKKAAQSFFSNPLADIL